VQEHPARLATTQPDKEVGIMAVHDSTFPLAQGPGAYSRFNFDGPDSYHGAAMIELAEARALLEALARVRADEPDEALLAIVAKLDAVEHYAEAGHDLVHDFFTRAREIVNGDEERSKPN
jgi:hypothetical protein